MTTNFSGLNNNAKQNEQKQLVQHRNQIYEIAEKSGINNFASRKAKT